MPTVETFSTILKDGEDLTKINAWLNRFRCGELVRFIAQRVTSDSTKIVIETQDCKRLRVLSSCPPNHSYLGTLKTVPYIDVYFSEPISLETFKGGEVLLNGTAIADDKLSTADNGYTLRVDTTGFTMTTDGQYELVFYTGVRHENKIWRLYGERKVLWSTCDHGGSRGGVPIEDPEKSIMSLARISVEGQHDDQKMIKEFYNVYKVDPEDVESMVITSGYPEFDRTTLWVIYCPSGIPYVKCTSPEYGACFFQDGAPDQVTVRVGFTEEVREESLTGNIYVDGTVVGPADWDLEQDGKLLTIRFTPVQYKHHVVKLASFASQSYTRTWPYAFSFVIHKYVPTAGVSTSVDIDDAASDPTTWVILARTQTGNQTPVTDPGITYNAGTNVLATTTFQGALNGNADTVTTNANMTGDVTSVGNTTTYNGTVPLNKGGTGATTLAGAKDALNIPFISTVTLTSAGSPYTLAASDAGKYYRCDTSGGNITVNLPAGNTMADGDVFGFIKTSGSNTLTIDANSTETINGSLTLVYTTVNAACILESNAGPLWSIASESAASVVGKLLLVTLKTTGTTFTTHADTKTLIVKAVGAGGGGGGAASSGSSAAAGGGGQSGSWYEKQFVVTGNTNYTVAIGTAGTAGANTGGNGGDGGETKFVHSSTDYIARGGGGGEGSAAGTTFAFFRGGSTGLTNTVGSDIVNSMKGDPGNQGICYDGVTATSGKGGTCPYGGGGFSMVGGGDGGTNGKPAVGYGGGGGGGCTTNGSAASSGGAGTQGMIIFEEYS